MSIEEPQLNMIKNRMLEEINEKAQDRIARKEFFMSEEAQARQDKKNKLDFIRATGNQTEEVSSNKEGPSVWSYEPDYYNWGKENPRYSIAGKLQSQMKGKDRYDENNPLIGFEQSIKLLANSITNRISNPNADIVKETSPQYSFPKSQNRFINNHGIATESTDLGPGAFYKPEFVSINRNKNKIF